MVDTGEAFGERVARGVVRGKRGLEDGFGAMVGDVLGVEGGLVGPLPLLQLEEYTENAPQSCRLHGPPTHTSSAWPQPAA